MATKRTEIVFCYCNLRCHAKIVKELTNPVIIENWGRRFVGRFMVDNKTYEVYKTFDACYIDNIWDYEAIQIKKTRNMY